MKSVIKRSLFVGMSFALIALTARRFFGESQIEGNADKSDKSLDHPMNSDNSDLSRSSAGTPAPILGDQPSRILPRRPAMLMAAPTVVFSGTVVRQGPGPRFALRETAGVLYPLDSAGRALPFEGEDVRVIGKLDLDTCLLYVDAIEPALSL